MSPTLLDMTNDFMILFGEHVERIALEKQAELEKEAAIPFAGILARGAAGGIMNAIGRKGFTGAVKNLPKVVVGGVKREAVSTAATAPFRAAGRGVLNAASSVSDAMTRQTNASMPSTNVKTAGIGSAFLKGVGRVAKGAGKFAVKNPGTALTVGAAGVGAYGVGKKVLGTGVQMANTAGQAQVQNMSTPSTGI